MSTMVVAVIVFIVVLTLLWKYFVVVPIKDVKGGYKHDIVLPHTEPIEFYFADISSMSMKVRFCLAAADISFKPHLLKLPAAGSFETKTEDYLRINPAGTVPVLVHNGHPIYESSDQLQYIAEKLVCDDAIKLMPTEPNEKLINKYWLKQTTMYANELSENMEAGLKRRAGNLIPILSLPILPVIAAKLSWKQLFQSFLLQGFTFKQVLIFMFATMGVQAFKLLPMLPKVVKLAKKSLLGHLAELEEFLKGKGTTFIHGDNITLADIGWAPILERLNLAGWWQHIDPEVYPCVIKYWHNMRSLPAYKEAIRPVEVGEQFLIDIKDSVQQWKTKYTWYKNLYE